MYDVTVIGGGPSGLQAAANLAQVGLDVLVLEAKKEVGDYKICTGIVSRDAFSEFELDPESVYNQIQSVKVISPCGNKVSYTHEEPFAYVVNRKKFDSFLGARASSLGVDIKTGYLAQDISLRDNCITVSARENNGAVHQIEAAVAVLATGINYNLHPKVGLSQPKEFLYGIQAEAEIENIDCAHIYFGRDFSQGAFGWMVPLDQDQVRLGLMTEKDPGKCFSNLMENCGYATKDALAGKEVNNKVIAQGLISHTYSDRVIAVGEAAGQVKNTTGGGIYFGLLCADIASSVILQQLERQDLSAAALAEYEKLWKKKLQKEIIMGYYSRKFCSRLGDSLIEKMIYVAQTDGVIPMVRKSGNFDWHGDLVLALIKRMLL